MLTVFMKTGTFSKKDFTQQRPATPVSVENGRQLGKELLESSSGLQRMLQMLQAFLGRCQSTRWCPVYLINLHAGFHDAEERVQPSLLYTRESSLHGSPSITDLSKKEPFSIAFVPKCFEENMYSVAFLKTQIIIFMQKIRVVSKTSANKRKMK